MSERPSLPPQDDEIDLRALLGTLLDHKWLIGIVTGACFVLGVCYAVLATPIYEADALVQVEQKVPDLPGLSAISQTLGASSSEATTEIALLTSRAVIGTAVADLNLQVDVQPYRLPLFGGWLVSHFVPATEGEVAAPRFGLSRYDWGGSVLDVFQLKVPASLEEEEMTLLADGGGRYRLLYRGDVMLQGQVGSVASGHGIAMQVRELRANAGARFAVTHHAALAVKGLGVDAGNGPWFGAIVSAALTILPLLRGCRIPMRLFLVACAWGVIRASFLSVLSKDLLAAYLILPLTLFAGHRAFGKAWTVAGLLYGWVIRKYWVLATLTWLGLQCVRKWLTPFRVLLGVFLLYLTFAIMFQSLLGQSLDFARSSMNENRVLGSQGSQTVIVPIFSSANVVMQAINAMLVLFRLVFPVELLRFLSPDKIAFVILTPVTIWWALKIVWASVRADHPVVIRAGKAALVPLAFLVVEGIFEPDCLLAVICSHGVYVFVERPLTNQLRRLVS
ncbi:Wzz/FepE/Etk N-terminal domain-containing protein [Dyella telluris]|uniref:Polysaccharide chain length determinant N-terminal domain-containing protein n=1 Tax=Dyella telluris TaxID=2763498 RepID=A0A7G8PZR6_9GAMM|nr:Wzz/FepE/Etk N-terminal domain-containing protein [Dyella telluris]QNK00024.1 hypothetical protein H8F01_12870 [Dyella telluris]